MLATNRAQPEDKDDHGHEYNRAGRDDVGRVTQIRGIGIGRGVTEYIGHVPVLAYARAHVTHQPHQPGEGHGQQEQRVLRPGGHPAPVQRRHIFRTLVHERVDDHADDDDDQGSQYLGYRGRR